jgi:hypothetical protein
MLTRVKAYRAQGIEAFHELLPLAGDGVFSFSHRFKFWM